MQEEMRVKTVSSIYKRSQTIPIFQLKTIVYDAVSINNKEEKNLNSRWCNSWKDKELFEVHWILLSSRHFPKKSSKITTLHVSASDKTALTVESLNLLHSVTFLVRIFCFFSFFFFLPLLSLCSEGKRQFVLQKSEPQMYLWLFPPSTLFSLFHYVTNTSYI